MEDLNDLVLFASVVTHGSFSSAARALGIPKSRVSRRVADLGLRHARGPVTLAGISERQDISLSYLEQLFGRLRRQGIVESVRGPGGNGLHGSPHCSRRGDRVFLRTSAHIIFSTGALRWWKKSTGFRRTQIQGFDPRIWLVSIHGRETADPNNLSMKRNFPGTQVIES